MSTHPHRRLTRRRAEHLLAAAPGWRSECPPALAAVLTAARRPAQDGELRGEAAAMAAFRAAHPGPSPHALPQQRRLSMIKIAIAKLVPIKLALAAAVATAAAGGLALAANAGALPNPVKPKAPHASASPQTGQQPGKPTAHPTGKGEGGKPTMPPQALHGLCTAYTKSVSENPGKALENPAFGALIEAAGGAANVPAFCAALPTPGAGNSPTEKPGNKPTENPGNKPTDKPGNRPTDKPGNAPTAHPTGNGH